MNSGIKTCAKCGAKNFSEFKTCFNCGSADFAVNKTAAPAAENVNKKAPVGLQHISSGAYNRSVSGVSPKTSERMERTDRIAAPRPAARAESSGAGGERRTIFDPTRAVKPQLSAQERTERMARAVRPAEESQQAARSAAGRYEPMVSAPRAAEQDGTALNQIIQKLNDLEQKFEQASSLTDTRQLQQTVTDDMQKLDLAIDELKAGNREFADAMLSAQQNQIDKLEEERYEYEEKLRSLREEKGRTDETVNALDTEKRSLEQQLAVERNRFDALLKDREYLDKLTPVRQPEIPGDYVVFTGDSDPDYLEYAKRQFLKIYPKIQRDENTEDVIYYIPGEFKNPPILVLNPDIAKEYKRNIKINILDGGAPTLLETKKLLPGQEEAPSQPAENEIKAQEPELSSPSPAAPAAENESIAETAALQSFNELLMRRREQDAANTAAAELAELQKKEAAPEPAQEKQKTMADSVRPENVKAINSEIVASGAIRDISEAEKKGKKNRNVLALSCILIGILAALSAAAVALDYMNLGTGMGIAGYEYIASLATIFKKDYVNNYVLIAAFGAAGPWKALAPYLGLLVLGGALLSVAAGVLCWIRPGKLGGVRTVRYVLLSFALVADAVVFASNQLVYQVDLFRLAGVGIYVKLAIDIAAIVLCAVFMRKHRAKNRETIRPLNIVDKPEQVPRIRLEDNTPRMKNEAAGK